MEFLNSYYSNFFSLGAIIPVLFLFINAVFFAIVPQKSRATQILTKALFIYSIFNIGYVISGSFYHPLAAYHRWITVFFVFMAEVYITALFFNFPEEKAKKVGRIIYWFMMIVSLLATGWFVMSTMGGDVIYHFEGHYWDFNADEQSYVISLLIIFFVIFMIGSGLWRVFTAKKGQRLAGIGLVVGVLLSTIVPAYLNTLSREGGMDRGTFQTSFDLGTILGMFTLVVVYINNTSDRTTFMAKILGISIVVFLLVFQGLNYFSFSDKETAYDEIHLQKAIRYVEQGIVPGEFKYSAAYDLGSKKDQKSEITKKEDSAEIDLAHTELSYQNTLLWHKISLFPPNEAPPSADVKQLLAKSHANFKGWANAIEKEITAKPNMTGLEIRNLFSDLKRTVLYRGSKIKKISEENFRKKLEKFLEKPQGKFEPFRDAIAEYIKTNTIDQGFELKTKVLKFLEPVYPPGARNYRVDMNDPLKHYTTFTYVEPKSGKLIEVGYDYAKYREFIHPLGFKLTVMLVVVLIVMLVGLPIFFRGALVNPLYNLLSGVDRVNKGDYNAEVEIFVEDEIGKITRAYNNMVSSIRDARQKLQEHAETLEEKVKERTAELQETLNQVQALKKQQDGDYFLTSLLTTPLNANRAESKTLNIDFLLEQKKKFEFRRWHRDIGGDSCIAETLILKGKPHTVFLNADAMGKSMQGAGGILVLGSVFHSILVKTKMSPAAQDVFPEQWLKRTFLDLHQVFEIFDGSMLVSLVMGLIDDESGFVYYINAEHPWTVLYRDGKADFIEKELTFRKLGTTGVSGTLAVATFQLKPRDVLFVGSDGRDDVLLGIDAEGNRIINEDETLVLREIEKVNGDMEKLKEALEDIGELTDDYSMIRIAYREDHVQESTSHTERMMAHLTSARTFAKKGDLTSSLKELEAAYELDDNHPDTLKDMVKIHLKLKNYDKAAALAEDYVYLRPSDSDYLYYASYCYKLLEDYRKAADLGERLRLRDHANFKNLINLADTYYLDKNYKRAAMILEQAEKADPQNPKVQKLADALKTKI